MNALNILGPVILRFSLQQIKCIPHSNINHYFGQGYHTESDCKHAEMSIFSCLAELLKVVFLLP